MIRSRQEDADPPYPAGARRWWRPVPLLAAWMTLATAIPAAAQPRADGGTPRWGAWATASLQAVGAVGTSGGQGATGALTVARGAHSGTFRLAVIADLSGFPDRGGGDVASEVALLYGRSRGDGAVRLSVSAGIAAVHFDACPGSELSGGCSTVGVPVVAEAALTTAVAGAALQAVANVNAEAPWFGLGLALRLGWMSGR